MLKILANPDADEEGRLEWMRTRPFPAIDDNLSSEDSGSTAALGPSSAKADRGLADQKANRTSTRRGAPKAAAAEAAEASGTPIST